MVEFLNIAPGLAIRRTWWMGTRDGKPIPMVICNCGVKAALDNHEVDQNGIVTPSFWHDELGCGFHEAITLVGYGLRPRP